MTEFEIYILILVFIVAVLEGFQVHMKAALLALMRREVKERKKEKDADKRNH